MHKHAVLLLTLAGLTAGRERLEVVDTHAGAGVYDLQGDMPRRSRESEAGIGRLLAHPEATAGLAPLVAAVRALNPDGGLRLYPGSPRLIADALRPGDAYVGCELRPDDHAALAQALRGVGRGRCEALQADGFDHAASLRAPPRGVRRLLLIDPPYERGDDYARIAQTLATAVARDPSVAALVWAPIKDLETLDALLRRLETLPFREGWAAEARLRPLHDPMRLNGSALVGLNMPAPPGLEALSAWVAASSGEPGARGRCSRLFV